MKTSYDKSACKVGNRVSNKQGSKRKHWKKALISDMKSGIDHCAVMPSGGSGHTPMQSVRGGRNPQKYSWIDKSAYEGWTDEQLVASAKSKAEQIHIKPIKKELVIREGALITRRIAC